MDIAVVAFVRGLLKRMVAWLGEGSLQLPAHRVLIEDFDRVVKSGLAARVEAPHLQPWLRKSRASSSARALVQRLLELAEPGVPPHERHYLGLLQTRLRQGNLSERIREEILKKGGRTERKRHQVIRGIYEELAHCLETNTPWRM
jgi:hypothetical protein